MNRYIIAGLLAAAGIVVVLLCAEPFGPQKDSRRSDSLYAANTEADSLVTRDVVVLPASAWAEAWEDAEKVPNQCIVRLRPNANPQAIAAQAEREHGAERLFVYENVFRGFALKNCHAKVRAALARNPNVEFVEIDGIASIPEPPQAQAIGSWNLDRIDQRQLPLSGSYSPFGSGAGVIAFIIDTGLLPTHSDFGGRASVGADFIGDGRSGIDCNGHGTHVAGTVGGTNHGIAKSVTLVGVRVLNCQGSGTWSQVIAGIDWVAARANSKCVANMSIGGDKSDAVNAATAGLVSKGCHVTVAAGNESENACTRSPASTPTATTVGATDNTDTRASWSNWGSCVDVFAPGVSITSAWHTGGTNTISGTSMAAPHVAGMAALVRQSATLTPAQVDSVIVWRSTKGIVKNASSARADLLFVGTSDGGTPAEPPPVSPPPPAPTNLAHSAIDWPHPDTARVRLTWTLNGQNLTGVQPWCGGTYYSTWTTSGSLLTSFTFRLLKDSWTCQVRARTDGGWGAYSTPATFTLGGAPPPDVPPADDPVVEPPPPPSCPSGRFNPQGKCIGKK